MRDRRREELNIYLSADKEIPTFTKHSCHTSICLLNLAETYNGAPNQVKAIEYLEKKSKSGIRLVMLCVDFFDFGANPQLV